MKKIIISASFIFSVLITLLSCSGNNGATKFEGKWVQASRASENVDSIPGLIITKNTDSFMVEPVNMKSFTDEKLPAFYNKKEDKLIVTRAGGIKFNKQNKTIMLDGGREFSKTTN
ncbi:MAG TPA: hypothetical protein PLP23_13470 [Panacibacter sp.]|mgnify:CR=1 FL=1|nr:hypothetical protein [Panacibacter sp.]